MNDKYYNQNKDSTTTTDNKATHTFNTITDRLTTPFSSKAVFRYQPVYIDADATNGGSIHGADMSLTHRKNRLRKRRMERVERMRQERLLQRIERKEQRHSELKRRREENRGETKGAQSTYIALGISTYVCTGAFLY